MSILIFLGVLFFLVLVHELGHFAVAKWVGMRVDEFGIGFPPRLFTLKRGETEYTFNLFPIGGFVKIMGEDGLEEAGNPQARADAATRSFGSKSRWAQAAVLVAGVTMNVLCAWLLFAIAFSIGVPASVSETEATEAAELSVTSVLPESPAALAGLPRGAIITSARADGVSLEELTPSSFTQFVGTYANTDLTLTYLDNDVAKEVVVRPVQGLIADAPERAALGVGLALVETVERSFFEAVTYAAVHTVESTVAIAVGIGTLIYDSIRMTADFSQVAGPVGIVGLVGEASEYGLTTLLMFTAFISLNLAVINILPFPALDGGRLLFVAIEAVKGTPIKAAYAGLLNTVGFFLLMALMVAVTWNDVARLI
jgi:regulator of sigma E protease